MFISKKTKIVSMMVLASLVSVSMMSCKNNEVVKTATREVSTTENTVVEETKVVNDDIYKEAIDYCVKNGIIRNTKVEEFSPKDLVKRELLAMILYRLENTPEVPDELVIPDVEKGRWYQRGAYYVIQNEIMKADSDGSFGVNKNVSKNEFANILWRYAGKPESDASVDENNIAVDWAKNNNIMVINNDSELNNDINREETAYAIMNLLKVKETPYMTTLQNETKVELPQAEFSERILIKSADGKEATIKLIDGKATREFLAQLPMNVSFMDFGNREKFGRVPNSLSEEEALLSKYEIGDFSYGTAYDCLIIFYDQDNEEIDGVLKLGEFETGLENFTNNDNMDVEISIAEKE